MTTTVREGLGLSVDTVRLEFGGVAALDGVSWEVPAGGLVGIIGPNGSGKTSLLNVVGGVYPLTSGRIRVGNKDTAGLRPHQIGRMGVSRTFQHLSLPELSVAEYVMLGLDITLRPPSVIKWAIGVPYVTGAEKRSRTEALGALEMVGLSGQAQTGLSELPYGLQKRADLARALVGRPGLLLLDEPASGLDRTERRDLAAAIREYARGVITVVVVEHDMRFISSLCERSIVLSEGQMVYEGLTQEALKHAAVRRVLLGDARREIDGGAGEDDSDHGR